MTTRNLTRVGDSELLTTNDALVATVAGHEVHLPWAALKKNLYRPFATVAGAGITGSAETFKAEVEGGDGVLISRILIDLTGLNCGGTAGDIIGADGAGAAHLGQITAARNGTIIGGRMTCLETPAGGDTDIDLYSATEATGVEDTAITALAETQLINAGAATAGAVDYFTAMPAADEHLYLVGQTGGNAAYTAGRFLIEMFGAAA